MVGASEGEAMAAYGYSRSSHGLCDLSHVLSGPGGALNFWIVWTWQKLWAEPCDLIWNCAKCLPNLLGVGQIAVANLPKVCMSIHDLLSLWLRCAAGAEYHSPMYLRNGRRMKPFCHWFCGTLHASKDHSMRNPSCSGWSAGNWGLWSGAWPIRPSNASLGGPSIE